MRPPENLTVDASEQACHRKVKVKLLSKEDERLIQTAFEDQGGIYRRSQIEATFTRFGLFPTEENVTSLLETIGFIEGAALTLSQYFAIIKGLYMVKVKKYRPANPATVFSAMGGGDEKGIDPDILKKKLAEFELRVDISEYISTVSPGSMVSEPRPATVDYSSFLSMFETNSDRLSTGEMSDDPSLDELESLPDERMPTPRLRSARQRLKKIASRFSQIDGHPTGAERRQSGFRRQSTVLQPRRKSIASVGLNNPLPDRQRQSNNKSGQKTSKMKYSHTQGPRGPLPKGKQRHIHFESKPHLVDVKSLEDKATKMRGMAPKGPASSKMSSRSSAYLWGQRNESSIDFTAPVMDSSQLYARSESLKPPPSLLAPSLGSYERLSEREVSSSAQDMLITPRTPAVELEEAEEELDDSLPRGFSSASFSLYRKKKNKSGKVFNPRDLAYQGADALIIEKPIVKPGTPSVKASSFKSLPSLSEIEANEIQQSKDREMSKLHFKDKSKSKGPKKTVSKRDMTPQYYTPEQMASGRHEPQSAHSHASGSGAASADHPLVHSQSVRQPMDETYHTAQDRIASSYGSSTRSRPIFTPDPEKERQQELQRAPSLSRSFNAQPLTHPSILRPLGPGGDPEQQRSSPGSPNPKSTKKGSPKAFGTFLARESSEWVPISAPEPDNVPDGTYFPAVGRGFFRPRTPPSQSHQKQLLAQLGMDDEDIYAVPWNSFSESETASSILGL